MTLTISFAPEAEAKLRQVSAMTGKDVPTLVREAVEEKLRLLPLEAREEAAGRSERVAAWEKWVSDIRSWGESNLPTGHVVDDSRQRIYEGRGE